MSDSLRDRQWSLLRELLKEVLGQNPFQRARLSPSSSEKLPDSLEAFVQRIPRTTKQEIVEDQRRHPPFGSNLTCPKGDYLHFCQTSGTTSQPIAVIDTERSWEWLLDNWQTGFQLAGVESGARAYFAFSFGPFLGFWTAFEAAKRMGLLCFPGGGLSSAARLHSLIHYGAEVLCCTPTYALHLAEVARKEGISLSESAVRRILVAGEPGGSLPAVRAQLATAWPGAEVVDHYGMTEVGPVAFASPESAGMSLRVLEERYFVEVLDVVSGSAVEEGEMGELTLTPLGRSAWPLLRYRTGDLVRARRDESGNLQLIGGILGRTDDMVIVRGVNLYPGAVEQVVRSIPEIGEYRVSVKRAKAMAEVLVEIESTRNASLASELERAFEKAFALRIPVCVVPQGSLPQFEFKARRWRVEPPEC